MVRILIADDHDLVRETIASFLTQSDGVEEVETVGNLQDALQKVVEAGAFDLVILDLNMPGMNGLDGLKQMKVANEPKPVAILSGTSTPSVAQDAIASGAIGFVPKTLSSKSISNAIGLMVSGEVFAPFDLMQSSSSASPIDGLPPREAEVLSQWRNSALAHKTQFVLSFNTYWRSKQSDQIPIKLYVRIGDYPNATSSND